MARIRTVKPDHWNDRELSGISLQAHLLWIGTWNFSDDEGVFENDPLLIRSQIFPRRTDIRVEQVISWLDQLVKARFIIPFSFKGGGYYICRTFKTHQKIDRPQPSRIPEDIRRTIVEDSTNDRERSSLYSVEESIVEYSKGEADKPPDRPKENKNFIKPDQSSLTNFFEEIGLSQFEAEAQGAKFFNYYESNGWKVGGKTRMKDWRATARGWKDRMNDFKNEKNGTHLNGIKPGTRAANTNDFIESARSDFNTVTGGKKNS